MTFPAGELYDLVDQFRERLLRNEREASTAMAREYGKIWAVLDRKIQDLIAEYKRSGGQTTGPAWIQQFGRLDSLRRQVEIELARLMKSVNRKIIEQENQAIRLAREHAERLTLAGMGSLPESIPPDQAAIFAGFQHLPKEAFANLVGFLQDGTPLAALLGELPGEGGKVVADGLLQGLILGQGAREIARNIRAGLGKNMARAMRISRTEILRAYREASHQTYLNNQDLIKGWIWRSARNLRTCAMCWAMDGTEHDLSERLDDHICGRCFMVPKTVTWKDLGYDVPEVVSQKISGEAAFAKLPASDQRMILGPAKYQAYKDKKITLSDLIGRKWSREWGSMRYERSLRDALTKKI